MHVNVAPSAGRHLYYYESGRGTAQVWHPTKEGGDLFVPFESKTTGNV